MLRASLTQKAGALSKYASTVIPRSTAVPAFSFAQRWYATTPKHIRRRQKQEQEAQRPPLYIHAAKHLKDAIEADNISEIITAYNAVRLHRLLGPKDVADVSQALHAALRKLVPVVKQTRIPADLVNFADLLVTDIKARVLPASYFASLHLLSFFKECAEYEKGTNFWKWLVQQDDSYVNANLYGVFLEMLAFQGRPAQETEQLYSDALSRFPGVFHQYHLAHNALLADRSQPTLITGLPMKLLQGVLTARILRGDATNAYLTLDTALRLSPTGIPSRFLTLFVQERPIAEAYTAFLLASRAGISLGQDTVKILLTRLKNVAVDRSLANAAILRYMLMICYAHVTSGSSLNGNALNQLVIAITSLLRSEACSNKSSDELRPVTDAINDLVQKIFDIGSRQGSGLGIASFNSIIANLVGRGKRKDLLETTLEAVKAHGLKPNLVTLRSVLSAASELGDPEAVYSAWTDLVAHRMTTSTALDFTDWQNLLQATRRINDPDFLRKQVANFEHVVPARILDRIRGALDNESFGKRSEMANSDSTDELMQIIKLLSDDVDYLIEHMHVGRNFHAYPMPISFNESELFKGVSDEDIRTVYDEMTTDTATVKAINEPSSEAVTTTPPSAKSRTGYPYGELRYQNWKTINELLFDAAQHDSKYMEAVDDAIKNGQTPPARDLGLNDIPRPSEMVGLSNLDEYLPKFEQGDDAKSRSLDELRQQIHRLRGPKPT